MILNFKKKNAIGHKIMSASTVMVLVPIIALTCFGNTLFSEEIYLPEERLLDIKIAEGNNIDKSVSPIVTSNGDKALQISWQPPATSIGMSTSTPFILPKFKSIDVEITISVTEKTPVQSFSLLIADATNEVFQYTQKAVWDTAGKYVLRFHVNSIVDDSINNWGGDGILDQACYFKGFGVNLIQGSLGGSFTIDSVKFLAVKEPDNKMINKIHPIYLFNSNRSDSWALSGGVEKKQKLELRPDGAWIGWSNAPRDAHFIFYTDSTVVLPEFTQGMVVVNLKRQLKHTPSKGLIHIVDRSGETFLFSSPVTSCGDGSESVIFLIDPINSKPLSVWGGDKNGEMDQPLHLSAFAASYPEKSSGEVLIESIRFESGVNTSINVLDNVSMHIKTGSECNVLVPGYEQQLKIFLQSKSRETMPINIKLIFRNFDREILEYDDKIIISYNEKVFLPCPKLPKYGIWEVECHLRLSNSSDDSSIMYSAIAYMQPSEVLQGHDSSFYFGISSHPDVKNLTSFLQIGREADAMALCGAKILRTNLRWGTIAKDNKAWDFSLYDKIVDEFSARGIEVLFILDRPGILGHEVDDLQDWIEYLKQVFSHYSGKVRFFEVINEPDLYHYSSFDAEEYLSFARIVRSVQQKYAPDAKLLSGGFATLRDHANVKKGFQEYVISKSDKLFDYYAIHEHGDFNSYVDTWERRLLPIIEKYNVTIPVWPDETAISSAGGVSERMQGITLYKKLLYSFAMGAVGYNWYSLREVDSFPPDSAERHYGLVTASFVPKPAYLVYNTITRFFSQARFEKTLSIFDGNFVYVFRRGNDLIVTGWASDRDVNGDKIMLFDTDSKKAENIDLMGNQEEAKSIGGMFLANLREKPFILLLSDATYVRLSPPLMSLGEIPLVSSSNSVSIALTVRNPYPQRVDFHCHLVLPPALEGAFEVSEQAIGPGEEKVFVFHLRDSSSSLSRVESLMGKIVIDCVCDESFSSTLTFPVRGMKDLPFDGDTHKLATLKSPNQLVSLVDADPTLCGRIWSGPQDLSAEVEMGCSEDNLLIKVTVVDDKHHNDSESNDIWKGDSIQCYLNKPGAHGYWEFGAAINEKNKALFSVWNKPDWGGELSDSDVSLSIDRKNRIVVYNLEIPLAILGLDEYSMNNGFCFNIIVNDNDEEGRDGFLRMRSGVGVGQLDPSRFMFICFPDY